VNFRDVYDAHLSFVWRSLRRLGVPDRSARDAVQDVFLVVYRRLPAFDGGAQITTWLFRICLRTAKDYRRRAHARRELLDGSDPEIQAAPGADAEREAERREGLALVEAALEGLTLEQRAVFVLFELEDMTGDEIAETLRIPLGTVYSRLRLGRAEFWRGIERQRRRRTGRPPAVGMS
jgi:RNA polymerase sigma-70 factor (ECF subfamily)